MSFADGFARVTVSTLLACAVQSQWPAKAASSEWRRVSDRLGSSLEVPADAAVSHDGETVVLQIKGAEARFWTVTEPRPGFPGHDPQGDMDLKKSDCNQWPPSYHVVKKRLAVYSCLSGSNISYYVSRYGGSGGVFLFANYPEREAKNFKPIISRMSSSMMQAARRETVPK